MKEFIKKNKVYFLAGSVVFFLAAFSYFGIFCLIKSIIHKADEVQKKMLDNEINQKKLAKIPQMKKTFEELNENKNKLSGILRGEEEVDFIKKLEILAEETQNKIDLKIIENDKKESAKSKAKTEEKINLPKEEFISLQADLTGDYSGLFRFVKKLENFEYYVNIATINVSVEENKEPVAINDTGNPFVNLGTNVRLSATEESKPKLLLKTQISFVAYIKK